MSINRRRFRYYATPDELKRFLHGLGYETQDVYSQNGERVTSFRVSDANIDVGYDIVVQGRVVGHGLVGLNTNPFQPDYSPGKAEASLKLYQKLYRKFRKPQAHEG
jgi:hypothetical protein